MLSRTFIFIHLNGEGKGILRNISRVARTASSCSSSSSHLYFSNKDQVIASNNLFCEQFYSRYSSIRFLSPTSSPPPFISSPVSSSQGDDSFLPTDSDEDSGNDESEDADEMKVEDVKERIFASAMSLVPRYGWTQQTLAKGAEETGLSPMSHGLMLQDGYELVSYHYKLANQQLVAYMKEKAPNKTSNRAFIEDAIKHRLSLNIPFIRVWPQAMTLMTQPANLRDALNNLTTLVDDICFLSGDSSLDHSWYTRRVLLAGVYKSTELFMIGQRPNSIAESGHTPSGIQGDDGFHGDGFHGDGFQATWDFLSRRMDQIDSIDDDYSHMVSKAPEVASSLLELTRNVLSLNNLKRNY